MKDPNGKRRRGTVLTNPQQWQNHYLKPLRNGWKRGGGRNRGTVWDQHLLAGLAFGFLQNVSYNLVIRALELIILSCTSCFPFAHNGSRRPVPRNTLAETAVLPWAEQDSNMREERTVLMSVGHIHIYLLSPLPCFQFQELCKQMPRSHPHKKDMSPTFSVSSVGPGQKLKMRNQAGSGIHSTWDWCLNQWLLSSKWKKTEIALKSVQIHMSLL